MADIQGLTQKKNGWRAIFLSTMRNTGNVRASAQAANISRQEVYKQRHDSPTFAKQWDEALQDAVDVLEAAAWKRASGTNDTPPSDTLLIFLLKCHRREVYGDKQHVDVSGSVDMNLPAALVELLGANKPNDGGGAPPGELSA